MKFQWDEIPDRIRDKSLALAMKNLALSAGRANIDMQKLIKGCVCYTAIYLTREKTDDLPTEAKDIMLMVKEVVEGEEGDEFIRFLNRNETYLLQCLNTMAQSAMAKEKK